MESVFSTKTASAHDREMQSVFAPEAGLQTDSIAQREAVLIADGVDLEKYSKEQEHNRHKSFRKHLNKATIAILWLIVASLVVGISTYVWHMVTPPSWHYLTDSQLGELKTVLVTAVSSSALTQYVKKRMD